MFKTDLQIAQECNMEHILKVAEKAGIPEEYVDCYGKYKGKISSKYYDKIKDNPDAKLILVTAVNPTPAGEGKTTVTIGLTEALQQMGKNAITCLREPSLGPCMGVKGGAAGGGYAQVVPMEDINLHFTGDLHAITTANNLLASMVDNHIQQGNELNIDPRRIAWKRCVDLNDRQLRNVISGLGGKVNGVPREDAFQITVASEIMAIFCLANDLKQLKEMLGRIIVGYHLASRLGRHLGVAADVEVSRVRVVGVVRRAACSVADACRVAPAHSLDGAAPDGDAAASALDAAADACTAEAALGGQRAFGIVVVLDGQSAFRLVFVLLKTRIIAAALQLVVAVQFDGRIVVALHGDGCFARIDWAVTADVPLGLAADVNLQVVEGDVHVALGGVDGDGVLIRLAGDDGVGVVLVDGLAL